MFKLLQILIPVLFVVPPLVDLSVRWTDDKREALEIKITAQNEVLDRCLSSGLEVRYRYELSFCSRRSIWFNACKDRRLIFQSIQYDAVSQTYNVMTDRHGDEEDEISESFDSKERAIDQVSHIPALPLSYLSQSDIKFMDRSGRYVSLRVLGECRGEYSEALAKIGYFLTLGMVKVSGFNSGWLDFELDK